MGGLEKNLQPSIITDNIQVIWKKINMVNVRKIEGNDNRPETSRVKTNTELNKIPIQLLKKKYKAHKLLVTLNKKKKIQKSQSI